MSEENISQEFRLKNIGETRNYLIEEINRNELMSKKYKKVCTTLNYFEHVLSLASTFTFTCFHFCFYFVSWYSYRNYKLFNWIKNLCNNFRN